MKTLPSLCRCRCWQEGRAKGKPKRDLTEARMIYALSDRNNHPLSIQVERFPHLHSRETNASLHIAPRKHPGRREKQALCSSS